MKPKTMILMVVAVGCGLVASYMTSQLLAERGGDDEPEERVKVLVARSNLDLGLLIKNPHKYFKEKQYLKGEEPAKALTDKDFDQLKDRRLIKPISQDQFVTLDDLVDKNINSLSARLPEGMRAVGIKVDMTRIAGGFASLPMSHVDIVSTLRRGDENSVSRIILENVLVLAADQESQRVEGKNAMPANTVTVALAPADAELVNLAAEMGTLSLILRSYGDTKPAKTRGANGLMVMTGRIPKEGRGEGKEGDSDEDEKASDLLRSVPDVKKKAEEKADAPKPEPKIRTHILTIYNGDQGRRIPYKLDEKGHVIEEEITRADPEAPTAEAPKKAEPKAEDKKPEDKKPEDKKPEDKKPDARPRSKTGLRRS
jgi:pilus assembly protein CpaB